MGRLFGGVRFLDAPSPHNVARIDHNALPLISRMHRNGIRVDLKLLKTLQAEFSGRQSQLEWEIFEAIGSGYQDFDGKTYKPFNIGSPDQVARLLFQHLNVHGSDRLRMVKSEKRPEVTDDTLERYRDRHPAVAMIGDYRELDKLLGTYIIPLQRWADSDSRVHSSFSVTTAATGRMSSRSPNIQNISGRTELGKRIRGAFIASPSNLLVSNDLSQIEMRWAAHLSQDPIMMDVFTRNLDIHDQTACEIFGRDLDEITALKQRVNDKTATGTEAATYKYFVQFERLPSKTVGFGILYGQTGQGLQESILTSKDPKWTAEEAKRFEEKWTLEECEKIIAQWYGVYSQIKAWMEMQFSRARRWGMIWDPFGRIRLVPEVYSVHKRIKAEGLRKAGNHPIQSAACATLKIAMAELDPIVDSFNKGGVCWPCAAVHDELIIEMDRGQASFWSEVCKEVFENATPISVPIKSSADSAETWAQLK